MWSEPERARRTYTPQAQTAAVVLSTSLSVAWALGTTFRYADGARLPSGWWFGALCFGFVLVYVLMQSEDFLRSFPAAKKWFDLLLYPGLALETILAVALLGWATLPTGGPVTSPYGVTLLSMALLAPFVTPNWRPRLLVLVAVTASYLGFWWIADHGNVSASGDVPEWLWGVTALANVVISFALDVVRNAVESKTGPAHPSSAPAPAPDGPTGPESPSPEVA